MSEDELCALAERAERIHAEYRQHFAGKSRFTRDLSRLDRLISDLSAVRAEAEAAGDRDSLLPVVRERESLYRAERERIAKVQAGGPDEGLASRIDNWARLARRRYIRNFAGQPRLSRDLGLLKEMLADMHHRRTRFVDVASRHDEAWHTGVREALDRNISLFESELAAITSARAAVAADRLAPLLATLANGQFAVWRRHFANRPRSFRRPPLLRRIIEQLEEIHAAMEKLRDDGVKTAQHLGNIRIVTERLATWRRELSLIESARGRAGPDGIATGLAEEANGWFQRYRDGFAGRDRASVDLAALSDICEGLHEVAHAMDELDRVWGRPRNAGNLEVVLENLKSYEREWELVKAVQSQAA